MAKKKSKAISEELPEAKSLSERLDDIAKELEENYAIDERSEGLALAISKLADAVEDIEVDHDDECE